VLQFKYPPQLSKSIFSCLFRACNITSCVALPTLDCNATVRAAKQGVLVVLLSVSGHVCERNRWETEKSRFESRRGQWFFFLAILSRSRVGPTQMEPLPPEINNKEFQLSSQQNLVPNIKEDQNYN